MQRNDQSDGHTRNTTGCYMEWKLTLSVLEWFAQTPFVAVLIAALISLSRYVYIYTPFSQKNQLTRMIIIL